VTGPETGRMRPRCAGQDGKCPRLAVTAIVVGCKHEHVHRSLACAEHIAQAQSERGASCYYCWRGTDPHRCVVMVVQRPT
jgi:hypothetical protein